LDTANWERFEELPDYKMFDEGFSALSNEACVQKMNYSSEE